MTDIATLGLKVDSTGVISATDSLNKLERQGLSTEKATDGLARSSRILSNALASVGAALSVRQLISYSDAYSQVKNQVKLTTDSQIRQVAVQEKLLALSNRTYTELGSSAELYATLARNTDGLNLSQSQLLDVVESVNKSFFITGKSSAEASGAIRQLSQAFSKGKLNGDEFVSVAEGAPEILRAIQIESGKTRGELSEMAAAGEISAELLVRSLTSYKDVLDKAAESVDVAFGSKLVKANNNIISYVGSVESSTGAVGTLGDIVVELSENLDNVSTVAQVVAAIFAGRIVGSIGASTVAIAANVRAQLTMVPAVTGVSAALGVQAAAATRATVAMNALAVGAGGARTALAFLGGPLGLIAVAASAFFLFRDGADEATVSIRSFADEIEKAQAISDLNQKIKEVTENIERLTITANSASGSFGNAMRGSVSGMERELSSLKKQLDDLKAIETQSSKLASDTAQKKIDNSRNSLAKLRDQLIQQEAVLGLSAAATLKYRLELGDLNDDVKALGAGGVALSESIIRQAESLDKARKASEKERKETEAKLALQESLQKSYSGLTESLAEQRVQLGLNSKDLFIRQNLLRLGADAAGYMKDNVRALSEALYDEKLALEEAARAADELTAQQLQQQQTLQKQYEDTAEKINDAFTGTFRTLLDGGRDTFSNLVDSAKSAVKDIVAELLTLAARPFIIQIAGVSAGLVSGSANAQGVTDALGGSGFSATDLASGVKSLFSGNGIGDSFASAGQFLQSSFGGANGAFLAANPSYAAASGQSALFSGAGNYSNLAYGGASLVAGLIGDKLFGGQGGAGSSLGTSIGLAAGGPIGAVLGGLLGGAIGGLFGGKKPSDKTQNTGVDLATNSTFIAKSFTGKKFSQENLDYSKSAAEYVAEYSRALSLITKETLDNQLLVQIGSRDGLRLLVDGVETVSEKSSEAYIRAVESTLAEMYDANVDFYNNVALENESLLSTFQRVEQQSSVLNAAISFMGISLNATGQEFDSFADSMARAAGSLQNVDVLWGAYFTSFYSDQERATKALEEGQTKLNSFMEAAGLDSLDLTLDNFRVKFEAALAGGLSAAETVDWLAASQFMTEVDSLASNLSSITGVSSSVSNLFANLETAVNAEKTAINERYDGLASDAAGKIDVLDERLANTLSGISSRQSAISSASRAAQSQFSSSVSSANAALSNSNSVLSVLNSALDGLASTSGLLVNHNKSQQDLLNLAASGGVPDSDKLRSAISGASNPSTSLFATFSDFQKDSLVTANALSQLKENTADQLSVDERLLSNLQSNAARSEAQFATRMAALNADARDAERYHDEQVGLIESQLELDQSIRDDAIKELDATLNKWDAFLSISDSNVKAVQSVADAVRALTGQRSPAVQGSTAVQGGSTAIQGGTAGQGNASSGISNNQFVNGLYSAGLGRAADSGGLAYWLELAESGRSRSELVRLFAATATRNGERFDASKIPAFAGGGAHSGGYRIVGEAGPELEFTGPSRIASNSDTKKMFDNSELVNIVKDLVGVIKVGNFAIAKTSAKTAKFLERWEYNGMPEVRI